MRMPGRHFVTDAEGNRYQFTGHEHDGETGYDYHGARYYNSELGRYMNVDPMASQGYGWTTYRYGYDNPVNYTDPTGMLEDFVRTEEGNVQYDSRVTDQGTAEKYYGKNAKYREEGHSFEGGRSGKQIVLGKNGHYTSDGVEGVAFDYASIAPESFGLPVAERSSEESFENNSIMAQHFGNGKGFATEGKSMFWSDPEKEYMWANSRAKTQAVNDLIEGMIYETVSLLAGGEIINGTLKGMYAGYKYLRASSKILDHGITTAEGFLLRGVTIKAPFNIPVQRFGNMSLERPDFWGIRIGTNKFANRTFGAIKTEWNPLTQYTTGIIPKGTPIKFGIIGPQGLRYPGGSIQFLTNSKEVINQSSKLIQR